MKSSNIGGQAVLEGIMMKNEEQYSVAVRKPNGEIVVKKEEYQGIIGEKKITKIPFIRGIFSFIDSLVLGIKALNYSAEFFEDEEEQQKSEKDKKKEEILMGGVMVLAIVLAVAIFFVLPYGLTLLLKPLIGSYTVRTVVEGILRIGIFLLYMFLVSRMKDIQRTFMYHGAEHKCINCIEHGLPLTVENVRISSRQHKRCGTSFLFLVMAVSVILLILIRVETPMMRVAVRLLLIPVIAGISYEILKLAGRSDNFFIHLLSKPGLAIQKLSTREPDDAMIEVAIRAVEAVFDWRAYEAENFKTSGSI